MTKSTKSPPANLTSVSKAAERQKKLIFRWATLNSREGILQDKDSSS